jgi:quinolinate synthase
MITSIVRAVESLLEKSGRKDIEVEIVFPVSTDAVSTTSQGNSNGVPLTLPNGLTIVPGAASGVLTGTNSTSRAIVPLAFN